MSFETANDAAAPSVKLPSRRAAIIEAAWELWPDGIPCGITRRDIEARVLAWLAGHGRSKASTSTVFLALKRYPRQKPRLTGFRCE
jgi:hypothetical protein